MAEYVEVVAAGPGWTQVRDSDGKVLTVEGNRNWRNNNPGNLEFGNFAKSQGAIGSDGRFAVFPTYDAGRAAKETLLFESPSYRDRTISSAINRYAPPSENNTSAYVNAVAGAIGVDPSTPLSQLTPQQRAVMLDAMQRVEGWKVGTVNGAAARPAYTNPIQQQRAEQLAMRQRPMAPAKPGGNMFAGLFDNIAGGIKGGINAGLGFFGNPTIMAPTPAPGAAPGGGLQDTIKDAMLGTVAGRTAIVKALMAQNIGQAPIMAAGRMPGGTAAYAVNGSGVAPVTLMRPATGVGGEGSRAFDALNHAGQNMDVYRANRAAIGGPITQGSINTALARGTTLMRPASDHPYSGESSISGFYDGVAQSLV